MEMNKLFHTDFTRLANKELLADCEQEFQIQMHKNDGEIFIWSKTTFRNVYLDAPSPDAQAILQYFTDCGCPIAALKLGKSLYPYDDISWPIRSYELSFRYLFGVFECLLNLKHDTRVAPIIRRFEHTNTFQKIALIASQFIDEQCISKQICPEILSYVNQHIRMPRTPQSNESPHNIKRKQ